MQRIDTTSHSLYSDSISLFERDELLENLLFAQNKTNMNNMLGQ